MVRRNRNKRRGIHPGVEKHKIRSTADSEHNWDPNKRKLLGIKLTRISRMAEACFKLLCRISCSTCGLPTEYHSGELFLTCAWKRLCIHYTWLAAVWVFAVIKTAILIPLLLKDALTVNNLMSIGLLLPCMCGATFGIGTLLMAKETLQLVNSWKYSLKCLDEPKGRLVSGFEDPALSIKVVGVAYTMIVGLTCVIGLNFIFPDLPVSLHNLLLSVGVGHSMPKLALQVCCFPVELLMQIQPVLSAGFGTTVLIIGIDVLKIYYEQLRTIRVENRFQRLQLQQLYVCGQVYNKILDVFYKVMVPLGALNGGIAIVLTWYLTIRHTELPLYIYCLFPYIAVIFSVVLFGLCFDGILVIRASEDSLHTLRSTEKRYFSCMPIHERMTLIKRAKALRPAFFSVGSFTEFTMDVPVGIWDEVVNQLLFLLTL